MKVTAEAARRFLVTRHFLAPARSLGGDLDGVLQVFRRLGSIQLDPIAGAGRDAVVTFEMAARDDHPRMVILDLGGGSALNVTEQPAATIVGARTQPGGRGPIAHYGIAVASRAALEQIRARLAAADADIGTIHQLGDTWSLFFRDPDGMELEVCTPA